MYMEGGLYLKNIHLLVENNEWDMKWEWEQLNAKGQKMSLKSP